MKILFASGMLQFFLMFTAATAQTKDISGTVTNEKNEAVVGASVKVKGTAQSAATDDNGMFTLQGIPDTATVIISAKGYQDMEVNITDKSNLSIILMRAAGHEAEDARTNPRKYLQKFRTTDYCSFLQFLEREKS